MLSTEVTYAQDNDASLDVSLVNISGVMDDHWFCTSDPWVYGVSIDFPSTGQISNPAPFHPTPEGQAAIAADVESKLAG